MSRRPRLRTLYPHKDWLPALEEVEADLNDVDGFLDGYACCYPAIENVFAAFARLAKTPKIIVIGQDPYPNALATGIAFQTKDNTYSLSLKRIAESLGNDGTEYPDWDRWIDEFGVLSINVALTNTGKDKNTIKQNINAWNKFMRTILSYIAERKNSPTVILFGKAAQKYNNIFVDAVPSFHPAARGRRLCSDVWKGVRDALGSQFEEFRTCTVDMQPTKQRR